MVIINIYSLEAIRPTSHHHAYISLFLSVIPMDNSVSPLEQETETAYQKSAYQTRHLQESALPTSYVQPHSYLERFRKERRDLLKFTPTAVMEKFPLQGNEGLYGWTFRNSGKVHLRDDLYGERKMETDLHECAHTADERETRYRTEERMKAMLGKKERYRTEPREYLKW